MKFDLLPKLFLFFGLLFIAIGQFMDIYGIEKMYISKQHMMNDGIILLLLTIIYLLI
jgi:hypothetical protein